MVNSSTEQGIRNAKITLEVEGAPPIMYTDSEGVFAFPLQSSSNSIRIRVEANGYEKFDRLVMPSARTGVEPIKLVPFGQLDSGASTKSQPPIEPSPPSPPKSTNTLYAYDGFDYTLGSVLQGLKGGTGWSGTWKTTSVGSAQGGTIVEGLSYTDDVGNVLPVTGGALATDPSVYYSQEVRNSSKTFGSAGESVWLSFLVKQSEEPLNGVNYAESTIGTGFTRGSNAMLGGIAFGDIAINPYFVTNTSEYTLPGIAEAGNVYLIVLRFDCRCLFSERCNFLRSVIVFKTTTLKR